MTRTHNQTQLVVDRIIDRQRDPARARKHIPAPLEITQRMQQVMSEFSSAASELVQLAIDLDASDRIVMGWEVGQLAGEVKWYVERDGGYTYQPAADRVAQIVDGTWGDIGPEDS